ncbi:MAG: tRNA-dihydrouridine synthase family protein [Paramuribaculum sp.]|nr:tRNA-dihydrouridine synthase family protein [Paramuribaculum sp.]MDE6487809.1 tRNA-dihydrouridine synthase family protein [Paramuribaculum sp.]
MKTDSQFAIMSAPLQGLTEAEFRQTHTQLFPMSRHPMRYFTPFVRIEKGEPRRRDIRDATSAPLSGQAATPQIICRDAEEFTILTNALAERGIDRIDINLGCPFPPQVRRGRGAGLLGSPERLGGIADAMRSFPAISFSVKMRLGASDAREWTDSIGIINSMPLEFVAIHPRTATQLYSGDLLLDQFAETLSATAHPVIYNGDITEPGQIDRLRERFPKIAGVMIGRGLLMRPSLCVEWEQGAQWPEEQRRAMALRLHAEILDQYRQRLSGDSQILSKIKPFWEYIGTPFDRKAVKKIIKAGTIANYLTAVAALESSISAYS